MKITAIKCPCHIVHKSASKTNADSQPVCINITNANTGNACTGCVSSRNACRIVEVYA